MIFLFSFPSYAKVEIDRKSHFLNVNFLNFLKITHYFVRLDNNLVNHIEQSRSPSLQAQ